MQYEQSSIKICCTGVRPDAAHKTSLGINNANEVEELY